MAVSSNNGNGEEGIVGINITPLVDVCLVLVIIFMVTAPILLQPSLPVKLPEAVTSEGKEKQNVTITITQDGQWAVNQTSVTLDGLKASLRRSIEQTPEHYVVIRADKMARQGLVLEALKLAKEGGARIIAIATKEKKAGLHAR